jgi:hypothetical protein
MTDISHQDIENKLMTVLYANENKLFNQYELFDKIIDRFNLSSSYINPELKVKFLLVLRNLRYKYDDIIISNINNIYQIIYNSFDIYTIKQESINLDCKLFSSSQLNNYIIDNDLLNELDYSDPMTGNTIYHDLIITSSYNQVKKLLDKKLFNFTITNYKNKTPLDMIKCLQMSNIFISELMNHNLTMTNKINLLENTITYLENTITYLENRISSLEKNLLNNMTHKTFTKIYLIVYILICFSVGSIIYFLSRLLYI